MILVVTPIPHPNRSWVANSVPLHKSRFRARLPWSQTEHHLQNNSKEKEQKKNERESGEEMEVP